MSAVGVGREAVVDLRVERFFRSILERAAPFENEPPLLGEVRRTIRDRLVHGTPTAKEVAHALHLGQRTLQRRLSDLGLGFYEVLDSTRRTLAEGYLADPTLSLSEVAYLLGYAEQASFFRAFRRWHGQTPAAFRRAHLS